MPVRDAPLSALLRNALQRLASRIKKDGYVLDPGLTAGDLAVIAASRLFSLLRYYLLCARTLRGFGKWAFIDRDVRLRHAARIALGNGTTIGKGAILNGLSRRGIRLGDNVSIGPYAILEASGILSSLGEGIEIGANSGLGAFSFVGGAGGVTVGDNVIMGQRVSFHSENHVFSDPDATIRSQGTTRQGIVVESDCWIGANVTFLDGSHVETGCVIGAGSVVRGRIPAYSVAAGVPAKVIKSHQGED